MTRTVLILLALSTRLAAGGHALARANAFAPLAQKAEPNPQVPATPQANSGNTNVGSGNMPQPEDNAKLQGQIQQALLNEASLKGSHVSVNVTDSAIQLSGTVASGKDKQTAERIAESFNGNRNFEDKLVVAGSK